jgi:hypothetical protein
LIWLDGGRGFEENASHQAGAEDLHNSLGCPWSMKGAEGHSLPVIRHKNMVALQCHKFADEMIGKHASSASLLHMNYGRSLRPSVMATDAFYALNEDFCFSASSEMAFLNLMAAKLDKYSETGVEEFEMLPNFKHAKEIMYRHIQKIQQILDSIRNTNHPRWPKATTDEGRRKPK